MNKGNMEPDIFADLIVEDMNQHIQYKKEPIKKSTADRQVYVTFDTMRKMMGNRTYFLENTTEVFIEQAKFMESFTDDYTGTVAFQCYYPSYYAMGDSQLRTYFTWRTQIRNGKLTKTSMAYVLVYIYELINNIGVTNPYNGIEKLIWLLKSYGPFEMQIEDDLVIWIKDYYICNHFDISFAQIVEKYGLQYYYPTIGTSSDNNEHNYESLKGIADYNFKGSKFYSKANEDCIARCFDKIITELSPLLSLYGMQLDELFRGELEIKAWWRPFHGAIYQDRKGTNKKVTISEHEIYIRQNEEWIAYVVSRQQSVIVALILGYIIKRIEAKLRGLTKFRYRLRPDQDSLLKRLESVYGISKNVLAIASSEYLDKIIDQVTDLEFSFGKENTKTSLVSEELKQMISKEPYLTFIKMRSVKELDSVFDITERFNIQSKILANLADDFKLIVPFESNSPFFDNMSNEQLRCYITWRSKVNNGEYTAIPEAYMRLYVYELVNNVKAMDEDDIVGNLSALLKKYTGLSKNFERLVVACIKDYYLCSSITMPFYELIKKHDIEQYYPNVFIEYSTELALDKFKQISNYNIYKSKFYNEQNIALIQECFKYVFAGVEAYLATYQLDLRKIIAGKSESKIWWNPFKNIPCYMEVTSPKKVVICSNEIYSYEYDEWFADSVPEKDNTGKVLVGFMVKRMEVKMREILTFKYKLSASVISIIKKISNTKILNAVAKPGFEQAIDDAVIQYFKEKYPRVFTNPNAPFEKPIEVKIDRSKLDKIRKDADIIRDKLLVDEDLSEIVTVPEPVVKKMTEASQQSDSPLKELCTSITELQKEALLIIINKSPSMLFIIELSQKNKLMPEMLLEEINEMALDLIGDNLIETAAENPYIYDDYIDEIKRHLEE